MGHDDGRAGLALNHSNSLNAVAVSRDGRRLAAGGDGGVSVWELPAGRWLRTIRTPDNGAVVNDIDLNADASRLATAGPWLNRLWSTGTGELLFEMRGHEDMTIQVCFSPDEGEILSGSSDASVRQWDARSGKLRRTLAARPPETPLTAIQFSPDGRFEALAGMDGVVRVWDARTAEFVHTLRGHEGPVQALAFTLDSAWLCSGSADRTMRVWDMQLGTISAVQPLNHLKADAIGALAAGGREGFVAFAGGPRAAPNVNHDVQLWQTHYEKPMRVLRGSAANVVSLAYAPRADRLASAGADGAVKLWDSRRAECLMTQTNGAFTQVVAFSPDGSALAMGMADGTLRVHSADNLSPRRDWVAHRLAVQSLTFSGDGRWLATAGADQTVAVWNWATGTELRRFTKVKSQFFPVAFHPKKPVLVFAQRDEMAVHINVETGEILFQRVLFPDGEWLAWNPDKAFYTSSPRGHEHARVVNFPPPIVTGTPLPCVLCAPASGSVFALGSHLVTCTATNELGTNQCSFAVTVIDREAPAISCPSDLLLAADAGQCSRSNVTWSVSATDNDAVGSISCTPATGSTFLVGTNSVVCRAVDNSENTNTCSFVVIVRDLEAPSITCPSSLLLDADSDQCSRSNVTWAVSATDNCAVASTNCVPPSGSAFPLGTNTVVCAAVDASGNTNSCSFTVAVRDVTPPTLAIPSDMLVIVSNSCAPDVSFSVTATDNCAVISTNCVPPSGSAFPLGTNTVVCTAVDTSGNTNTATFTVTVLDTTPPVINCSSNLMVVATSNATSAVANYSVMATDNCSVASTNCVPPSGAVFPLGVTVVNCGAIDPSGNTNACSFTVTLCSPFITVVNTNDSGSGSLRWAIANVCPGGAITFSNSLVGSTIVLTSGELLLDKSMAILGLGATNLAVSGNNLSRIFSVTPGNTVVLSGLTLTHGHAGGSDGGAIRNEGHVTLDGCVVRDSTGAYGGGIISDGRGGGAWMVLSNSTGLDNHASVNGGGIASFTSMNVVHSSTLASNRSDFAGGGVYAEHSAHAIINATFSANLSTNSGSGEGAGIFFEFGSASIRHSTFAGNATQPAIADGFFNHLGTVTVQNSARAASASTATAQSPRWGTT